MTNPSATLALLQTQAGLMVAFTGFARVRSAERVSGRRAPDPVSLLRHWIANRHARRQLRLCASLDPRFARDVGLTESEIARECRAPFWVAVGGTSRRPPVRPA